MAKDSVSYENSEMIMNMMSGLSGPGSRWRDTLVDMIFDDSDFKNLLRQRMAAAGDAIDTGNDLVQFFANQYVAESNAAPSDQLEAQRQLLDQFVLQTNETAGRFLSENKPNPDAVWWPNPERGDPSLFDILPVAERYSIIDKTTPIGSAGSCFAVEIAQNLLSREFNYLCLEKSFDPETGTIMAETDPANPVVQFSCRWGILFNTPSFTQVVENAFGEKDIGNFLVQQFDDPPILTDPYRERVIFPSIDAYRIEREKHLANTRTVFENAEVFVVTLGLNEAWQYLPDGTYLSRNPRISHMRGMVAHRKLSVQENIDYLQRFIDIVRHHNPRLKLIISVSPVPFLATGRADKYHVITANCHSKAVLRVAAEEIVERNRDVFYLPSYEVVTTCSEFIWQKDQRHIHPAAVARVMALFDEMFVKPEARG